MRIFLFFILALGFLGSALSLQNAACAVKDTEIAHGAVHTIGSKVLTCNNGILESAKDLVNNMVEEAKCDVKKFLPPPPGPPTPSEDSAATLESIF